MYAFFKKIFFVCLGAAAAIVMKGDGEGIEITSVAAGAEIALETVVAAVTAAAEIQAVVQAAVIAVAGAENVEVAAGVVD